MLHHNQQKKKESNTIRSDQIGYFNRFLFTSKLVAKNVIVSSGTIDSLCWTALLAVLQIYLLINIYDHCHHSMHAITARVLKNPP